MPIIATLLWSSAFVGIKLGLPYSTPINFAGLRFMFAGIIVFIFSKNYRNNIVAIRDNFSTVISVSLLQTALLYFFFYQGLSRIDSSLGAVVTGFSPLIGTLLAHFILENDKLTPKKIFAFFLGLIGIMFVTFGRGKTIENINYIGITFMFLSSFASGFAAIFVLKKRGKISAIPLNSSQLFIGGFMLFLISFFIEDVKLPTNLTFYISLTYLSLLSAVAFTIWFYLLQSGSRISELNIWKFIIPVFGAILSWIILPNESPSLLSLFGIILTGLSLFIYYFKREVK